MAKDKITLVQFRKQIAAQTGFDENVVGAFLKQYFDVITEGLRSDAQVRIKDFGSFRIQTVEPRRSVDVRTGESIQLAGYNKVIFAASTILKEHVEAEEIISIAPPQSAANEEGEAGAAGEAGVAGAVGAAGAAGAASVIAANDPIKKLGQQAEEIKDILAELGITTDDEPDMPEEPDTPESPDEPESPEEPDEPETPDEPDIPEEPDEPETPDEPDEPETPDEPDIPDEPEIPEEPEKADNIAPQTQQPTQKPKKKRRPWLTTGIIMLVLCVLLTIAYFVLEFYATDWINDKLDEYRTEQIKEKTAESEGEIINIDGEELASEAGEEQIATQTDAQTDTQGNSRNKSHEAGSTIIIANRQFEILRTEVLTEGSRLAWLSRKYYGEPDFWVYIYLANEQNISDPNDIPIGTKILIPKLPLELINTNDEDVLKRARELQDQILNR